jgi:hypothetical protein
MGYAWTSAPGTFSPVDPHSGRHGMELDRGGLLVLGWIWSAKF